MWRIKSSKIQGVGIFSTRFIPQGTSIDVGIIYYFGCIPEITYFGSKINHSYDNNVVLRLSYDKKTWNIYASKDIQVNTEILLDYNDTPFFVSGPSKSWGNIPVGYKLKQKWL